MFVVPTSKKKETKQENKKCKKVYFSYAKRLSIHIFLFFIFFPLGVYLVVRSLNIVQTKNLSYREKGTVDYSVCLQENTFYESECLNGGMSYIASLIDTIPLQFQYQFMVSDERVVKEVEYEILAKLVISDKENTTNYYEKNYTLQTRGTDSIRRNGMNYLLNKDISIHYNDYNEIATNFKSQYGVDTESYLEVYLIVYHETSESYQIPSTGVTSVKIPLSQKAIQIQLDSKEVSQDQNNTLTKTEFTLANGIYLALGIFSTLLATIYAVIIIRMIELLKTRKNAYDKYLSKILKEYDRLIVETSSFPNIQEYHLLKIKSFNELLDVHDNLNLPIMHYHIAKHQKSAFYILQDKNLYLFTLKAIDLEKKQG